MAERILVVEDSEPLRKILAEKLHDAGYEVLESGTGEEGFKIATETKPDMIITDLVMFPVDGIDMTIRIRESGPWGASANIIALTNQGVTEEEVRLPRAKFNAYFVKAATALDDVIAEIKKLLHGKKK